MDNKNSDFVALCDYLKNLADRTNAGRAFVDFTKDNGDVFRIEYIPSSKKE